MKNLLLTIMTMVALTSVASQPIIDEELYQQFNPHHYKVKSTSTNQQNKYVDILSNTRNSNEQTCYVDFVIDFDTITQLASRILLVNSDSEEYTNESFDVFELNKGSNIMEIPCGVYDIIMNYKALDPLRLPNKWPLHNIFVIHEQVSIDGDMQINFSSNEAKNHIHFQTLTPDGQPVNTGKYTLNEDWHLVPLEPGNVDDVFYHSKLVCKDFGEMHSSTGNYGAVIESELYNSSGGESGADFYINNVSDRYVLYAHRAAIKGNEVYTSSFEVTGATNSVTISNDPSRYKLFEESFDLPLIQEMDRHLCFLYYERGTFVTNKSQTEIFNEEPLNETETFKYYIGASTDDSEIGYVPCIQPQTAIMPETGQFVPVMASMPLTNNGSEIYILNNGVGSYRLYAGPDFNGDYINNEYIVYPEFPTHPVFSYSIDKKQGEYGHNCPLLVTNIRLLNNIFGFDFDYVGRYGEKMRQMVQAVIKVNGEDFYTTEEPFFVQLDSPLSGEVEVVINDDVVTVEGVEGSNKAQLHFTTGNDDQTPPTATMLHFKDGNGNVTNHFTTPSDGVLEFSAGDFNFILTPEWNEAYTRQAPKDVTVSYSLYSKNDWKEITVNEVPEKYWPVMGWFYTSSLANVTREGQSGWFDLKIKLTDAAGNWQEQVISPAFKIDSYTGISDVNSDNTHEVARYNLAGQRVGANTSGVVIVRYNDGTARKMIVK